ncbi:ATP-grasp domain-containing protein [Saprospiraceae bacterium]|nr:ATP-grasp domain-containing protein [Saprospiraceae bacterium]
MLFFTAANPGIKNGGAFLVAKDEIYKKINPNIIPKTLSVNGDINPNLIIEWMGQERLQFPILVKPNHGLRGIGLSVIRNEIQFNEFVSRKQSEYLIQEFIEYKNEIGIFFTKDPKTSIVKLTSIVKKNFMEVQGDGIHSIEELVKTNSRYAMHLSTMKYDQSIDWNLVLGIGEIYNFERIGNHSRGATFLDGNSMISPQLTNVITNVLKDIDDVYYGRLDLKYNTDSELVSGNNFKIIELNGAFSEPAHIYDPSHSLLYAWKEIIKHFSYLFKISDYLIDQGVKPMKLKKGLQLIAEHFKVTSKIESESAHDYVVA